MFPRKTAIEARAHKARLARYRTLAARVALRRTALNTAVSPRGLLAWFALGATVGRKLKQRDSSGGGLPMPPLSVLLPLLRLF